MRTVLPYLSPTFHWVREKRRRKWNLCVNFPLQMRKLSRRILHALTQSAGQPAFQPRLGDSRVSVVGRGSGVAPCP